MSDSLCAICGRPTPDGEVCQAEADRADGKLQDIAELAPDARLVAAGLVRRGGGSGSNKPGSRPPLNDSATDALDEVQNTLTTLARRIAEDRGLDVPRSGRNDPIVTAARWLRGQVEWLRHAVDGTEPYAVDAFDEIGHCAGRLKGLINGPTPGRYAGPCGYVDEDDELCGDDVLAKPGSSVAVCKTCGSEYNVEERQAWMRGEIEDRLARPVEIAGILLQLGIPIGYSTIAAYAAKGQLVAHGHDEKGRPTYRIGDVLELRINPAKKTSRRRRPPSRDTANPVGG